MLLLGGVMWLLLRRAPTWLLQQVSWYCIWLGLGTTGFAWIQMFRWWD